MNNMGPAEFRVLIIDDYERTATSVPAYEKLQARANITVINERIADRARLAQALRGINALVMMRERSRFGEPELALADDLRLISQTGSRAAHLDVPAATRRGIPVAVGGSDNGFSTTELTIGLILALSRQITQLDRRMRGELWPAMAGRVVERKTAGVIGFGRIGKEVARVLKALRMRVLAYSRTLTDEQARAVGAEKASMESLLRNSDVVTIHVPLNDQTRGLIGAKEFAMMKRSALFINTSRGPLAEEAALIHALASGHLAGAGLDVFDVEPLPLEHPLRGLENVILLPHRGYAAIETLRELFEGALTNILDYLDGKPINLLNPEVVGARPAPPT